VKALNRKLWRELWQMKGQVFAITLVVTSGVATFIMFISTFHSLEFTRAKFYNDYNFADVFVNLKRAPESLKDKKHQWHQSTGNTCLCTGQAGYQGIYRIGYRQDNFHSR